MSQQYDNNLTGVLFVNDKQGNEKRPDWKGSAEIDGVQFWVSGWNRQSARGELISLKLEKKEQQQSSRHAPAPAPAPAAPLEGGDIPF